MKFKINIFTIILCLLLLAFSMSVMAKVDLTFWSFPTIQPQKEGQEAGWYEARIINEFEAIYPEVKITHQIIPWADGSAKFNVAIASGAGPDITWNDSQLLWYWAKQDLLLDFEDILTEEEKADYPEFFLENCKQNGKVVVLPWTLGAACMTVNYDIAKAAGALDLLPKDPLRAWTYEEFEAYIRAIKPYCDTNDIYTCGIPAAGAEHHTWLLMIQGGAEVMTPDLSKCILNSPEGVKVLEWFLHLRDTGLQVPHPENEPDDNALYYAYMDGKAAVYFCAGTNLAFPTKTGLNSYLCTKPGPAGIEPRTWASMLGIAAFDNGDAEKAKYAKLFCKFWADKQEELKELAYFPAKQSIKLEYENDNMKYLARIVSYAHNFPDASPYYKQARKLFSAELQAVYAGIKTPQEALDDFCDSVNALIAQ